MIIPAVFGICFVFGQLGTLLFPDARVSLLDICTLSLGIWFVVQSMVRRQRTRIPNGIWIVLFVISAFVSTFLSHRITENLLYVVRWTSYALLYVYLVGQKKGQEFVWAQTLYWSGVAVAVLGFVQLVLYPYLRNLSYLGWDPHLNRMFSTLFDPNFAGIIYVLTGITGIFLVQTRTVRRWGAIGIGIAFAALLFTYSRSSYLACIAAIVTWIILQGKWKIGLGVIVLFFIGVSMLPRGSEGQNLLRTVSSYARLGSVVVGWDRFIRAPIFGTGFVASSESIVPSRTQGVDMSLLAILASTGIVGFVLYVAMWWHILKRTHSFFIIAFVAVCVHSLFTNSLLYPWVMAWLWIAAGVSESHAMADR